MQEGSALELKGSHKRGIEVTLALLDEALAEFEQWALGREQQSVMYREENNLSAIQRGKILHEIGLIREMLLELREALQLKGRVSYATAAILGQCSTLWVHVLELHSKYLRGYGELPAGLAGYLDPKVRRLLEHLNRILLAVKAG